MLNLIRSFFVKSKSQTSIKKSEKREVFETKYFRNYELVNNFKLNYKIFCDQYNNWDFRAFPDSNATNRQYYETIKQVSEVEYSEQQRTTIQTVFIHENALEDYIYNLDVQYHNLKLLNDEIKNKI